jgi:hypothetical protein
MHEYDLAVVGILWGTAIAFALAAVTMVDSGRKGILIFLWACAVPFLIAAFAWPWVAEKWPEAKAFAQSVSVNQVAVNAIGLTIFGLLVLDFIMRRRWLVRGDKGSRAHEINQKLENVRTKIGKLESTNNPRDILLLLDFVVHQSTILMLDDLLQHAPAGITPNAPLQLGGDFAIQNTAAKEFIELIRRKMDPGSWRRSNFENVMSTAEREAEHALEQTPMHERPHGIDPLALRRWVIVHRQCAYAITFLNGEKNEAEEKLRNQRFNLLERYREVNKS